MNTATYVYMNTYIFCIFISSEAFLKVAHFNLQRHKKLVGMIEGKRKKKAYRGRITSDAIVV